MNNIKTNKEIIKINNLSKQFNKNLAVKNINFKINKGSIVGLLGPNGCGKTTTIGMMLGLIKPTSGTVFVNGQNIESENNRTNILEKMNFDQIIPIIYLIGVLILVLPSFLHSNSKLKQLLANLSIWVIIVLILTTISYFLLK